MNKVGKRILLFTIPMLLIAGISLLSFYSGRIPENDVYLAGNTGGNLYNNGLFCESEGRVYFSNSYDRHSLYSMNTDETDIVKLDSSSESVYSINIGGDYLYYCQRNNDNGSAGFSSVLTAIGMYRSKTDGSQLTRLKDALVASVTLCGNDLYYLGREEEETSRLYKIKTDNSEETEIVDYVIDPSSYAMGMIYFAGTRRDHNLYGLDTATDSISVLLEGNIYRPVYDNHYIYYMDQEENYRLCRYSLSDNRIEVLTGDRVDVFNVGNGIIFYQKNDLQNPALYRMNEDGSHPELIAEGNYTNINFTSQYAYYQLFGDEITLYRTPLYGPPEPAVFDAARQAAETARPN